MSQKPLVKQNTYHSGKEGKESDLTEHDGLERREERNVDLCRKETSIEYGLVTILEGSNYPNRSETLAEDRSSLRAWAF